MSDTLNQDLAQTPDNSQKCFINPPTPPSFPSLTGDVVFYRSYSRRDDENRYESWNQVVNRIIDGLKRLGELTFEETRLLWNYYYSIRALPSGRWMWVGGTEWIEKPENYPGAFNCSSTKIDSLESMALMMDLAMMGCGTGAILESRYIDQLPIIRNKINLVEVTQIGTNWQEDLYPDTGIGLFQTDVDVHIIVGDSRRGWVKAYLEILEIATSDQIHNPQIRVDLSYVRPAGVKLKGFGGVSNPVKLSGLFPQMIKILNGAVGRKLTAEEVCLLIDEAANTVVAGNIRRSAGIRQFDQSYPLLKLNLWKEVDGNWQIDPERDALRMANHTRVYHHKPTEEECIQAVRLQYECGEGAIQFAPESIARANVDILNTQEKKSRFIELYLKSPGLAHGYLSGSSDLPTHTIDYRMSIMGTNPCGEIILIDNFCNLSEVHLNQLDPFNFQEQEEAFKAAALSVVVLLKRGFVEERYQKSRELDPIVGVSFTGLFDFFVNAFGVDWLKWWEVGRPQYWGLNSDGLESLTDRCLFFEEYVGTFVYLSEAYDALEQWYLNKWKSIATQAVWEYCDRHNLKRPNRCTTVQPAGSKSLLTGASPGWHPPKAARYIRRITCRKNDPVAMAGRDLGYSVIPSQSDKDEEGNLLNNPFDSRCTEWLLEIPIEVSWADLPGADQIKIESFSALAQIDFYMQVQKYYTTHNCFDRKTQFLTDKGIRSFEDFEVGDIVKVLNANGRWSDAEVVNTGTPRTMYEITIKQGSTGKIKRIIATGCHRFPTKRISGGSCKPQIKTTLQLRPGHRLLVNSFSLDGFAIDKVGIQHGLVFGDGSKYKNKSGDYIASQLYLCQGKRELVTYFMESDRVYERDDCDQTRIYGLPVHFKELPPEDCSQEYLAGFIAGLVATDGNISESCISLSTSQEDVANFIHRQAPRLGILVTRTAWFESGASGYKAGSGAFQIGFSKESFPEELILRSFHLQNLHSQGIQPRQWKVVSVEELPDEQVGWCVMEPETNHFTLAHNILVMNTSATVEIREHEVEEVGKKIYQLIQNDEGYISATILARFDDTQTFPRLPFEPISKAQYEQLKKEVQERKTSDNYLERLNYYSQLEGQTLDPVGPAGCDSDKCLLSDMKPQS